MFLKSEIFCLLTDHHTPKRFPCTTCGRLYTYLSGLKQHLKYECGKTPQFQCPYCPHMSKRKGDLKSHIAVKHFTIVKMGARQ